MKTIQLTVLLLLSPIIFFAQTLTGLWQGSVHNDSTTIRKDAAFEIVLTQYKDKVYGYSRSTFTVHDSLFYILKRVKGTIDGDVCEVKDDDIISYNFQGRLDKGVKMVSTFRFDHNDSVWRMDGDWKTNKTKKYYSLSGKIALSQEKDLTKSKIFPHLEELKLANDVAFYDEYKKASEPVAATSVPRKQNDIASNPPPHREASAPNLQSKQPDQSQKPALTKPETNVGLANNEKKNVNEINKPVSRAIVESKPPQKQDVAASSPSEEKPGSASAKITTADPSLSVTTKDVEHNESTTQNKPTVVVHDQPANDPKNAIVKQEPATSTLTAIEQKKEAVIEQPKPEAKNKEALAASNATNKSQPSTMFSDSKPAVTSNAAVFVAERKISPPQIVNFVSDSLELALYDNGEIDGDTVSVLLNGEIILARQGLKASAIKKMIYVPAGKDDSLTLVLYAENLGKYPPNTGLLIVHDGDETYQIRFSADLTQNAAVIFKRKRK